MQKLDDVDRKILDILIDNTRTPFTDIAKRLLISAGTVHVRVKKMEDLGIIKGEVYGKRELSPLVEIILFFHKLHLSL
jgi:Lrp/AsnC family transcriptional regulator for asnA, asnC and gidA